MGLSADPGAIAASAIVASAGLWWFRAIMKDVRKFPMATRIGIYILIWLAYFIVMMVLVGRAAAPA